MAAAKDTSVKVQLNLKRGDDMLNLYATTADEMAAIVDNTVKSLPDVAKRFGLTRVSAEAPSGVPSVEAKEEAAPAAPPAAVVPSADTPTSDGEALSPREKARLRLKGGN